ncbi:MAG: HlyD family type I secretion periplasmic adaptor subunit [Burkholderiaceae bacterium]
MTQLALSLDQGISFDARGRRSLGYILAIATMCGALAVWAALAQIDTIVRAEGRIIPSARSQVVQHLEGGIVRELSVREGDTVVKGELLLSIDPTRADATLAERKAKRTGLRAKAVRLLAVAEGRSELAFGADIDPASPVARAETEAFLSWRNQLAQQTRVLQEQVRQKQAEIAEYRSRAQSLGAELEVAKKQLGVVQTMFSRGSASRMDLLDAQARLRRYQTQVEEARAAVPRLTAAIGEVRERKRDLLARAQADARTELAQVRTELDRVDQEIRGESDRVARTDVRSPVDGTVNRIHVNTIGGVVRPGDPIVELTPSDGKILVEGFVRPADRADLREGIRANVRVSAFDSVRYGRLPGEVVEVSADTVPDAHGQRFYRVRIAVDPRDAAIPVEKLSPGITASADLVTGRRTVLDYLVSPLTRFGARALSEPR